MTRKTEQPRTRCRDMLERFSQHLEGELDKACCTELEQHLKECPDCVKASREFKELLDMCRKYGACKEIPDPSPDLAARIIKRLKEE